MTVSSAASLDTYSRPHFTVRDVRRMIDSGVIAEGTRLDVLDGDIFVMNAESSPHRIVRLRVTEMLAEWLFAHPQARAVWQAASTPSLLLDDDQMVDPDIALLPRRADAGWQDVYVRDVPLIIEVARSSLLFDTGRKRPKYATAGLAHYWIINVEARQLITYAAPVAGDYGQRLVHEAHALVPCPALPGWSLDLSAVFA
jgi:Uma2 family endonuclease